MSTTVSQTTGGDGTEDLGMNDIRAIFLTCPFSLDRVTEPGVAGVDVAEIHAKAFDTLRNEANEALRQGCGVSAVVWGEAGVGKSHVLARLADWANKKGCACLLLQNINAAAPQLIDSIRKSVVSQLTWARQGRFVESRLYDMIEKAIMHQQEPGEESAKEPYERLCENAMGRHCGESHQDAQIYHVIWEFLRSAYKAAKKGIDDGVAKRAVQWLSGDRLAAEKLAALGIAGPTESEDSSVPNDYPVTRLLVTLGEIARGGGRPFILCLDQIEVLDADQVARLAKFLHVLLDRSKNLLLVVSGVQETLVKLAEQKVISTAAWQRIRQRDPINLPGIVIDQARKLLQVRMERPVESVRRFPEVWRKVQEDGLFPLGSRWFENSFKGQADIRPRKAVNLARERWQDQERRLAELGVQRWLKEWSAFRGGAIEPFEKLVDEIVARRIDEQCRQRAADQSTLPPDAANFAGLTEKLLQQCQAQGSYPIRSITTPEPTKPGRKPIYDRFVEFHEAETNRTTRTGVVFVTTDDATSAAGYLRRISEDVEHPDRVVLVTDARMPLHLAKAGKEHLDSLESQTWFEQVSLEFVDVAMLDSLHSVVGQAKAGDIDIDMNDGTTIRVSEHDVVASHHRNNRYRAHPLLGKLLELPAVKRIAASA